MFGFFDVKTLPRQPLFTDRPEGFRKPFGSFFGYAAGANQVLLSSIEVEGYQAKHPIIPNPGASLRYGDVGGWGCGRKKRRWKMEDRRWKGSRYALRCSIIHRRSSSPLPHSHTPKLPPFLKQQPRYRIGYKSRPQGFLKPLGSRERPGNGARCRSPSATRGYFPLLKFGIPPCPGG